VCARMLSARTLRIRVCVLNADWIAEGREIVAHRVFGLVARARVAVQ
jgi:hypothetical protein